MVKPAPVVGIGNDYWHWQHQIDDYLHFDVVVDVVVDGVVDGVVDVVVVIEQLVPEHVVGYPIVVVE